MCYVSSIEKVEKKMIFFSYSGIAFKGWGILYISESYNIFIQPHF